MYCKIYYILLVTRLFEQIISMQPVLYEAREKLLHNFPCLFHTVTDSPISVFFLFYCLSELLLETHSEQLSETLQGLLLHRHSWVSATL